MHRAYTRAVMDTQDASEKVDQAVEGVASWWNNPQTHELFIERPVKIVLILLVAIVLNWLANGIIRRATRQGIKRSNVLKYEGRDAQQIRAQEKRRQQRMKTLANVGRSVAAIVIWAWAVLAVLDQLGVNVAPLIASAGVVGVAIGFGAQSLVKDFFSGVAILIENQFGVGDTIEVGDVVGDVEEMTLRITTLRDIDGALWYIRNGDIDRVGNHSARFSTARVQVPVSLMVDPAFDRRDRCCGLPGQGSRRAGDGHSADVGSERGDAGLHVVPRGGADDAWHAVDGCAVFESADFGGVAP